MHASLRTRKHAGSSPAGGAKLNRREKTEWDKRKYFERRTEAILLLGGVCVVCGTELGLEFDHIDPKTKSFTLAHGWSRRREVLMAEVRKCQLLCHVHHQIKTLSDAGLVPAWRQHGTVSSYRYCKCPDCRAAKSISNRTYLRAHTVVARELPDHGDYGMYRKGCRCPRCREANTVHHAEYRRRRQNRGLTASP